jgi:Xaa-Pro aminopeptidase
MWSEAQLTEQRPFRGLRSALDELRGVKGTREIALIRRASQLAGRGLIEAMKSTRPGAYEYQLDASARYVFLANGARLEGYRSITAAGTDNIWNMHYYRNLDRLKEGDLVLMDFVPEYRYYTSDIARMWPVDGKFRPEQRELLQFVLAYRNCVMKRIRPGVTPRAIQDEAKASMEEVFQRTTFSFRRRSTRSRRLWAEMGCSRLFHRSQSETRLVSTGLTRPRLTPPAGPLARVEGRLRLNGFPQGEQETAMPKRLSPLVSRVTILLGLIGVGA